MTLQAHEHTGEFTGDLETRIETTPKARWMDPNAGTFLSVDPLVGDAFDPQSVNAYSYARNNPVSYTDPTGMCIEGCVTSFSLTWGHAFQGPNILSFMGGGAEDRAVPVGLPWQVPQEDFREAQGQRGDEWLIETEVFGVPIKILGGGPESPGQFEGALQAAEFVLLGLGLRALGRALFGRIFGKGAVELSKKTIRKEIQLFGGRSGQRVPGLTGPPNSIVRGGGQRVFVTDAQGKVVSEITRKRVKSVIPGQGFGPKRAPTAEELKILEQFGF